MKRHRTAFVFQPRTAFAVFVVLTLVLPRQISAQHIVNPNELTPTLYELLDSEWAGLMRESPEWATGIGYPGENDRWSDISEEGNIRRRDQMSEFLGTLELGNRINYLDDDDSRLDYEFARRWASDALDGYRFHDELLPISQIYGVQLDIPSTLDRQPHKSVQDYQDIFSRLSAIPTLIEQTIVLMQHGIDRKITQPKIIMRDVPEQILELIPPDSVRTPLLSAFYDLPESLPATTRLELLKRAHEIYSNQIAPAFRKLYDFLVKTYIPNCRETIGMSNLPNGKEWYRWKAAHHTTTLMQPEQIFDLGMKEVTRITSEMDSVRTVSGFAGDLAAYFDFLRHDKQFFFTDSARLVDAYREIVTTALTGLPKLFLKLPHTPIEVLPIPLYAAPSSTTAYYENGSARMNRPGVYRVNTYDLASRPKWEMQPLSLHEAVPGHHLQISFTDEMTGIPELRKYIEMTAFTEGWALYAESLGSELGFYTTPADKMGQLSYEMWRAIRLVVDVGIHSKNWTRDQAIEFFTKNSPKSKHDIEVEIDRYIADPGQALAYKIGERKIEELREYANEQLAEKFDIRAFHDKLLSFGSLPISLLDREMKRWILAVRGYREVVGTKK